jgi:cytidine deaminase
MDHRPEHKDRPEQIVTDLFAAKDLLEVFFKAGKALVTDFEKLQANEKATFLINGATIEGAMVVHLIEEARRGREQAYAPYSHFNVGAAILAENRNGEKRIFYGCNVENAAYGSTVCAERTATFKAVSEGFRKFHAFAMVGGFDAHMPKQLRVSAQKSYITPCGSCRQVTNEFEANPCIVIMAKDTGEVYATTLNYLLPAGFGPRALGVEASSYDGMYNKQVV